jgi:hypothetical protein
VLVLVEDNGFILAQQGTDAAGAEARSLLALLDESPGRVRILTADTGYSLGQLRRELERRNIEAHVPLPGLRKSMCLPAKSKRR